MLITSNEATDFSQRDHFACVKMAKQLHLKLPCLKVTLRPTSGPIQRRVVHRGAVLKPSSENPDCPVKTVVDPGGQLANLASTNISLEEEFTEGPSLHKIQRESNARAWERIRQKLLHAGMESEAMPLNQVCIKS